MRLAGDRTTAGRGPMKSASADSWRRSLPWRVGVGAGYWWGERTPVGRDAAHGRAGCGERRQRQAPRPSARSCTTAIRWDCPTPRRCRRRIRWAWTTSPSTMARSPTRGSSQIKISIDKVQKLGVRSEAGGDARAGQASCKAVGRIEVDERRVYAIAPKFEGWVERLLRQRHRPAGQQGPAAVRGLQPGAGVRAARIRDRHRGGQGAEGRRRRPAGRHEAPRRLEPGAADATGTSPTSRCARWPNPARPGARSRSARRCPAS